ncbi:LamG domain-containing protein [Marinobacter shengliensis]
MSGNVTTATGVAADLVRIFYWPDRAVVSTTEPDPNGDWSFIAPHDGEYGVTYIADGCQPITHGPYFVEGEDPFISSVVSLVHFDGNFADLAGKVWTGGAQIDTEVYRFPPGAGHFPRGPYVVSEDSADWAFGVGDFTVEAYVRLSTMPASFYFSPFGNWSGSSGWCFFVRPGGYIDWRSNSTTVVSGVGIIEANTWVHLAYSRKSGVGRLFVDGQLAAKVSDTQNISRTSSPRLGGNLTSSDWWSGHVDEFRVTKGVARYVDSFVPPIHQFPYQ